MTAAPSTANATFCATLVDQWVVEGLTHAFVAPGSRSTPLAIALHAHRSIDLSIFHDERAAAFAALGHGLATQRPGVVLCTSGTAGSHFYAAVIEADLSAVPLLVCTADRPPELWGRGAPQTIDQRFLFGPRVRAFLEMEAPDDSDPKRWRPFAQQAWSSALSATPGPVHCNLSFRDPLTGRAGELTPALAPTTISVRPEVSPSKVADIAAQVGAKEGVIIAGRSETAHDDVLQLARRLRWPIFADHRSGCRVDDEPLVIGRFDSLLRDPDFADSHRPDVVFRVGEIVSSKAVSHWLTDLECPIISTRPHGRLIDPENVATTLADEVGLVAQLLGSLEADAGCDPRWSQRWVDAEVAAQSAVDALIADGHQNTEVSIACEVVKAVPARGALVAASSMPVRDIEWFGPPRNDIRVYANRGANGIDGTVATAIGIALTGTPIICLIGDIAFLHDSTSLIALRDRSIDLTIVVIDNDGGGIFSFLPQHELLDTEDYEILFGTPHGTDIADLCHAHGIPSASWPSELTPDGVRIVIAESDRSQNLAFHNEVTAAVSRAVRTRPVA